MRHSRALIETKLGTVGRKSLFSITRNDFNALPTKGNNLAADKNRVDVIAIQQFKSNTRDNDLYYTERGREREVYNDLTRGQA